MGNMCRKHLQSYKIPKTCPLYYSHAFVSRSLSSRPQRICTVQARHPSNASSHETTWLELEKYSATMHLYKLTLVLWNNTPLGGNFYAHNGYNGIPPSTHHVRLEEVFKIQQGTAHISSGDIMTPPPPPKNVCNELYRIHVYNITREISLSSP